MYGSILYLCKFQVARLFGQAFDPVDVSPIKPIIPMATDTVIETAVEMIAAAKKPVLLIGSQALLPPIKAQTLRETVGGLID